MPTVVRVGDTAGGSIGNSRGIQTTINGVAVAVEGDAVAAHLPCPDIPIHCSPVTTATLMTTVNGIRVVVTGDPATCAHPASASAASRID